MGSAPLRRLVEDISLAPESALTPDFLSAARHHAAIDALWLATPEGDVIWSESEPNELAVHAPFPTGARPPAETPPGGIHYFTTIASQLLEIRSRPVAGNRWLFAGHRWDETHRHHLAGLIGGNLTLVAPDAPSATRPKTEDTIRIERTLTGWDGKPEAHLRLEKPAPDIAFGAASDQLKTKIFLIFGTCLIASLAVSLHGWVMRPLYRITEGLRRQNTEPLEPLLKEKNEFTQVARLMTEAFEHRDQLRREIAERHHAQAELQRTLEERARLGRDLHDGVIQSLYAAGMGVVAARKLAREQPEEAEKRLVLVGDLLNDTIRDVRNYIIGLEPGRSSSTGLAQSVRHLFTAMNSTGSATLDLEIDEDVEAALNPALRAELLLFIREAFSNALRHGGAKHLDAALLPVGTDRARLHIADDGKGLDPASVRRGRGLINLETRARLNGARFSLDSNPGKGSHLTLELPLHHTQPAETTSNPPKTTAVKETAHVA